MKKKILYRLFSIFILVSFFYLTGCATVEQTIYLGEAQVTAPLTIPPTHLNINKETGSITFSPKVSVLTNGMKMVGVAGDRYSYSFRFPDSSEYRAKKENLEWDPLKYNFGLDIDWKVGDHVSLFGGINSSAGKNINLEGGNIGIGFHNQDQNSVIRFDIGLNIQKYNYFAVSIVHTKESSIFGDSEYWDIFGDKGSSVNFNPFISLTMNSSYDPGFINYFGTIGIFSQSLLDFEPGETDYKFFPFIIYQSTVDERAGFISYSFYANPGVSFSLMENIRFVISTKFLAELSTSNSRWFIIPSAQLDFQL
ncbi:MAG TPA: hypothetical protein VLN45_02820 [Ignavibacteriaceae bacterium]|nr:hypothetical protein [Ignavibacteriaceae bacterium]